MRLWHKDLISVLPREQLVAQWRELSAIAGNIQIKNTPNHILVNKVIGEESNLFTAIDLTIFSPSLTLIIFDICAPISLYFASGIS